MATLEAGFSFGTVSQWLVGVGSLVGLALVGAFVLDLVSSALFGKLSGSLRGSKVLQFVVGVVLLQYCGVQAGFVLLQSLLG
ncbi:MAG: hypothetical protein Kow0069_06160 [Promethearchaeota archaeon]